MKNILAVFCILLMMLVFNSCNSSSSIVTFDDNSEPGRRDYVWTIVDSTGSNLSLTKIWGDSPDNIWFGGGFAINQKERLWHYDGNKLSAVCDERIYPNCIYGFGKNSILVASDRDIWKYDGAGWNVWFTLNMYYYSAYNNTTFNDINGTDVNNYWAIGTIWDKTGIIMDGIIYQNKGDGWRNKYMTSFKNTTFVQVYPGYADNQCFIWGIKVKYNPFADSSTVWEYDGKKLKQIYSGIWRNPNEGCAIDRINGLIYITIGSKIYRYYEGKLVQYLTVVDPDFFLGVFGRNEKDLFLWTPYGLLHYNGTDIQYVFKPGFPITIVDKIIFFEKEIYFFGKNENNGKYYFYKGVLPDKK
jgi:hypothetical protein